MLTEVVEPASAEEARNHASQLQAAAMTRKDSSHATGERRSIDGSFSGFSGSSETPEANVNDENDSGLRRRLKAAIKMTSISGGS